MALDPQDSPPRPRRPRLIGRVCRTAAIVGFRFPDLGVNGPRVEQYRVQGFGVREIRAFIYSCSTCRVYRLQALGAYRSVQGLIETKAHSGFELQEGTLYIRDVERGSFRTQRTSANPCVVPRKSKSRTE